jgi:TIR domain
MAHDVFISHSAKDKATADAVCAMLEGEGIRCWIAPRDVLASREYGEAIIDAIEECRIMVLVFTANANASPQIRREIERAVNHGVAILPLRMEDVLPGKSLEYFIGNVHWLDALTPPFEAHLKNLAATIKILLARNETGAPAPLPQEVRPQASGGVVPAGRVPEAAGMHEKALAPHRFWSARSWTWAGGAVAVLLLVAVFVGVHFKSAPSPVASTPPGSALPPPGTPGTAGPREITPQAPRSTPQPLPHNPASLRDTMKAIQTELSGIGSVSYISHIQDKTSGKSFQNSLVKQVSKVVVDSGQCRVNYHLKLWRNGTIAVDKDAWFLLPSVTSVVVAPMSQVSTEENAALGHANDVVTSTTPPVEAVVVYRASIYNELPFADSGAANRFATDVEQAVRLCGGHLAN